VACVAHYIRDKTLTHGFFLRQVDAALDATNVARVAHYIRDKTRGLGQGKEAASGEDEAPSSFQSIVISLKVRNCKGGGEKSESDMKREREHKVLGKILTESSNFIINRVGQNYIYIHTYTVYIRYFCRDLIKHMVIYGVYIYGSGQPNNKSWLHMKLQEAGNGSFSFIGCIILNHFALFKTHPDPHNNSGSKCGWWIWTLVRKGTRGCSYSPDSVLMQCSGSVLIQCSDSVLIHLTVS